MSITLDEILDEIDAKMLALLPATYPTHRAAIKATLFTAIATGIFGYTGSGTGLSNSEPENLAATPSSGGGATASRYDHVHRLPTLAQLGAEEAGAAAIVNAALVSLISSLGTAAYQPTGAFDAAGAATSAALAAITVANNYADSLMAAHLASVDPHPNGFTFELRTDTPPGATVGRAWWRSDL